MGKFVTKTGNNGQYYFNLVAGNGQVIGKSQMYENDAGRDNGIASVKSNAPNAPWQRNKYEYGLLNKFNPGITIQDNAGRKVLQNFQLMLIMGFYQQRFACVQLHNPVRKAYSSFSNKVLLQLKEFSNYYVV